MTWVAGVDGCKGGWFVLLRDTEDGSLRGRHVDHVSEVLEFAEGPQVVAIDMPIGLSDHAEPGGRQCDREARNILGWPRRNAVFPPPIRAALRCSSRFSASEANRQSSPANIRIGVFTYGLFEKLREADEVMESSPGLQNRVREIHPELCFFGINDRQPMQHRKKSREGFEERRNLLARVGFGEMLEAWMRNPTPKVAKDDVLDACAACWSAERILKREAVCIPNSSPIDSRGLRMEMWY
jgi:predicted RNase H-like nuclease